MSETRTPSSMAPAVTIVGTARVAGAGLATAACYFALSRLGLAFQEPMTQVAVVWLAGGFALAALLVVSRRTWPVLALGVFVGNLAAQLLVRGVGWLGPGLALVNALSPLVVVALLTWLASRHERPVESATPAGVLGRLLVAIVVGNAVGSLAGSAMIVAAFGAPFGSTFLTWYLADALGFLMVAPIAIAYRQVVDRRSVATRAVCAVGATAALTIVVFFPDRFGLETPVPLPLLLFPVLLLSALRAGLRVTSVLLVVVGIIGAWATAHGSFPLAPGTEDVSTQIAAFQLFLATVVVCSMLVSAIAAESDANEQAARAGRERVESVLAALTEYAVIATDVDDGRITFFNSGAERLLGYRSHEAVGGLTAFALHDPDELEERMSELGVDSAGEALTRSAVAGRPETRRWTYRCADGSRIRVMLTVSAEYDDRGALVGFIGVARALTEEERREQEVRDGLLREREIVQQLRAANEARGEFVSTVSHELRTPLTNVIGYAEMLGDGDFGELSTTQASAVSTIEDNSRRLLLLVEDLLTLNGMDTGRVTMSEADVDLEQVVTSAVEQMVLLADRSGVGLDVVCHARPVVRGDAGQIERMLANIVGNAVKFTPARGTVTAIVAQTSDGIARIAVEDTGVGIPADELDQVFDRFFRSREAFQQAVPGTGLGLAIARSIVDAHGGTIGVESTVGVGTTVTIEMPARTSARRPVGVLAR